MKRLVVVLAALGILGGVASADQITYTETVAATGTLGGTPFADALVTVTLTSDTSKVTPGPGGFNQYRVNPGPATINIAGLGTATFTDAVEIISSYNILNPGPPFNEPFELIATLDNPQGTSVTGVVFEGGPAFLGYDLKTSFGPVSAPGASASGLLGVHHTNMGDLIFSESGIRTATFTATEVPEPASITLLLSVLLLGLTSLQLRRKRA